MTGRCCLVARNGIACMGRAKAGRSRSIRLARRYCSKLPAPPPLRRNVMTDELEVGRALREPALVSDQAPSGLDPAGFDPARDLIEDESLWLRRQLGLERKIAVERRHLEDVLFRALDNLCQRLGPRWFLEQNWAEPLDALGEAKSARRDRDAALRRREAAEAVGQQPGPERSEGIAQPLAENPNG